MMQSKLTADELAEVCAHLILILEQDFTKRMTVSGLILAKLASGNVSNAVHTKEEREEAETVPSSPSGKILTYAGTVCYCHACKRDVYKVISDVYSTMPSISFRACFEPVGHSIIFPKVIEILSDDSGNIATDCPLCKGVKSLWIVGHGEPIDLNQVISEGKFDA